MSPKSVSRISVVVDLGFSFSQSNKTSTSFVEAGILSHIFFG
jgi:hypothetical protein